MTRQSSLKSISFVEPTEESYHPAPKPLSNDEEKQHHDAQEEFISKRGSHICSFVFGLVFVAAACALFWAGADLNLKDLTILGAIFLVFGLVLTVVSFVLLMRGYRRARNANNKVFDREFVPKRARREDTAVTQSDISMRGLTPVQLEQRRPTQSDLYSDDAIKPSDINKFQTALREHCDEKGNSQSRTVIQLSAKSDSPNDDVVIIHDARIALPNPVYRDSESGNNSNNSSHGVTFSLETAEAHLVHLPGTPDSSVHEDSAIPQAFHYIDPNATSTNL